MNSWINTVDYSTVFMFCKAFVCLCDLFPFMCFFSGYVTWLLHVNQVTFQGCDINEARHLYDHLAVMCPIMVSTNGAAGDIAKWVFLPSLASHCIAGPVSCLSHLPRIPVWHRHSMVRHLGLCGRQDSRGKRGDGQFISHCLTFTIHCLPINSTNSKISLISKANNRY